MQQGKRRLICICRIIKTIVLAFIQYNQSFIFVIAALYHFSNGKFASFLLLEVFILPLVVQTLFLFQLLLLQFGCLPVWLFASLVVCQFGCFPLPCICRDVKTVSVGSSRPLDRDHCYHRCHHRHHCLHYHQSHCNIIICNTILVVVSWLLDHCHCYSPDWRQEDVLSDALEYFGKQIKGRDGEEGGHG